MNPIIPRKSNSKKPNPEFDAHPYTLRHLVESLFAKLKHDRSIGTRFEKLARNFKAIAYLACTMTWVRTNWERALGATSGLAGRRVGED